MRSLSLALVVAAVGAIAVPAASRAQTADVCANLPPLREAARWALPEGLSEWNPAGLAAPWQFDGSVLYAAPASVPAALDANAARGAESDGAEPPFRGEPECAPGRVAVWRYRSRTTGRYRWVAGKRFDYQLGAYYFDTWSPRDPSLVDAVRRTYGRYPDPWGGVRDFYGKSEFDGKPVPQNTQGVGGSWPQLMPRIGYYDIRSPQVLAKHIDEAADAGLSYFSFYWYWNKSTRTTRLGEGIEAFLAAPNRQRLQFNVALFSSPWDPEMHISRADAPEVARQLAELFARPEYLKLPDGRPVFFIGDTRNIGDGSAAPLREFIDAVRRAGIARSGKAPFVTVNVDMHVQARAAEADGLGCIASGVPEKGATSYRAMLDLTNVMFRYVASLRMPFSPCVTLNFDERPRQGIMYNLGRYLTGRTDALYREALFAAKDAAEGGSSPAARMITVFAWNEWHEGATLEPNAYSGARDLNILSDVFRLPRAPSKCLESNACGAGGGR